MNISASNWVIITVAILFYSVLIGTLIRYKQPWTGVLLAGLGLITLCELLNLMFPPNGALLFAVIHVFFASMAAFWVIRELRR